MIIIMWALWLISCGALVASGYTGQLALGAFAIMSVQMFVYYIGEMIADHRRNYDDEEGDLYEE